MLEKNFESCLAAGRRKLYSCDKGTVPQYMNGKLVSQEEAKTLCKYSFWEPDWWSGAAICDGTPTSNKGQGWKCGRGSGCGLPPGY